VLGFARQYGGSDPTLSTNLIIKIFSKPKNPGNKKAPSRQDVAGRMNIIRNVRSAWRNPLPPPAVLRVRGCFKAKMCEPLVWYEASIDLEGGMLKGETRFSDSGRPASFGKVSVAVKGGDFFP
jgi:hypothetical protein